MVDEEVGGSPVEARWADVDHEVIRFGLRRLLEVEQVARTQRAGVPGDEARVVAHDSPRVGELCERRLWIGRDTEEREVSGCPSRTLTHVRQPGIDRQLHGPQ